MSIRSNIILALKGIAISWKQIVLVYCIFPILITSCLGYFFKDAYEPETKVDKINITIVDKDDSKSSKELKKVFQTQNIKKIFSVSKNSKCIITIPKGYEKKIIELNKVTITISDKSGIAQGDKNTIENVINEYGKFITENKMISNKVMSLSKEDRQKVYDDLENIYSDKILKNNFVKPKKNLNAYENLGYTLINYIIISIAIGIVGSYKKERKDGVLKRIMAMPMKKEKLFNLNVICYFIYSVVYGGVYILGFIVTGFAFGKCNFINLSIILICQSLVVASLSAFIIAFFSERFSLSFLTALLFFQTLFGGAFIPITETTNNAYAKICDFSPLNVISEAYKNCMIFNSFASIEKDLCYMIFFSIVIYLIAFFKIKIRWETN